VRIINNIPQLICVKKGKKPLYEVVKCPYFKPASKISKKKRKISKNQALLMKWIR